MKTNKILYLDNLRVISIIAVIALHTAAPLLYDFGEISNHDWLIGNFYDSAVRWCVPIFLMISGALLLNSINEESISLFIRKRAQKLLLPFLFWSIIFYFWLILKTGNNPSVKEFLVRFANNDIYYHLWYIYALFGLYIVTPIFRLLIKYATQKTLIYFLLVWFIFSPCIKLINSIFRLEISIYNPIGDYLGYFILGYFLSVQEIQKRVRLIIYIVGIASFFITFLGTYFLTVRNNHFVDHFYDYITPNIVIMSIAIFVFLKNNKTVRSNTNGLIKVTSKTSFGIYLIHPIILEKCLPLFLLSNGFVLNPIYGIPFITMLTLLLSAILILTIQSIPLIKKIAP